MAAGSVGSAPASVCRRTIPACGGVAAAGRGVLGPDARPRRWFEGSGGRDAKVADEKACPPQTPPLLSLSLAPAARRMPTRKNRGRVGEDPSSPTLPSDAAESPDRQALCSAASVVAFSSS